MESDKPRPRYPFHLTEDEIEDIREDIEEVSMLCCEGKHDECIEKGEALLDDRHYDDDSIFKLTPWEKLRLHLVLSNTYEDTGMAELHLDEAFTFWTYLKEAYAPDKRPDIDDRLRILREEWEGIGGVLCEQMELEADPDYDGVMEDDDEVDGSQEDELEGSQEGDELDDSQEDDNEATGGSDLPRLIEHAEEGLRQLDLSPGEDIASQPQHGTSLGQMTGMKSLPRGMHSRTASSSMSLGSDATVTARPSPTFPTNQESTSPTPNVLAILMDQVSQAEASIDQLTLRVTELEGRAVQAEARIDQLTLRIAELEGRAQQDATRFNLPIAETEGRAQQEHHGLPQRSTDSTCILRSSKDELNKIKHISIRNDSITLPRASAMLRNEHSMPKSKHIMLNSEHAMLQ
ncbi:hypothetical protein IQ07DRAFT_662882 [Pyrenochaeta sp. DS3sAY3a]|nr:hypothetical protein IQ07DRAFT_662882 [Pyrenochaeta sp. DS3sAY3a]